MAILSIAFLLDPFSMRGQSSTTDPGSRTVLVLAKVEQPGIREKFENTMVNALEKKGYHAIASYSNIRPEDTIGREPFMARLEELGVNALLAFRIVDYEKKTVNTPTVSASVGVPVRVGFMSVFVGGSVPLGGGPKQVETVNVRAALYTDPDSHNPCWTLDLSGNLNNGTDALIYDFTKKTAKALVKQKAL